MSSITINPETAAVLTELKGSTEIRDTTGKLIGIFTPERAEKATERVPLWSPEELEEAERILAAEKHLGKPLKEVWRDIKARAGCPMRYTVVWIPQAEATLANLWVQAAHRQAVADASDRLDAALAMDPETKGKPLGKFFVREDSPLAVLYHVQSADRMVWVISVKRI